MTKPSAWLARLSVSILPGLLICLLLVPIFSAGDSIAQGVDAGDVLHVLGGFKGLEGGDLNDDGLIDELDMFLLSLNWRKSITQMIATSPLPNEADVAITRETILEFSAPLDPDTIDSQSISATFAGNPLSTRLNISPDRKKVTVFYADHLPASARVRVTVDGNRLRDHAAVPVDVDRDGFLGGIETIDFDTLTLTTIPGTAVCGRVFASELATAKGATTSLNVPLKGVRITVDGMEDTLFALTDNLGNFRLEPAPAGKFFVHVDGRTVTSAIIDGATVATQFPDGYYYPFVGKAWVSSPSKEVNIGNIFLPLVISNSLQPVSQNEDTRISFPQSIVDKFPEFEGVQVTVPADSLYADDGARGGKVGIAPVPPDRLPGTLPTGLEFPLVITVQTDGPTNFDVPAPVCFPNLPDPSSGEVLPPGAKSGLYSFNHDIGEFSYIGPMTVSEDGKLICSDPGVGIQAPGWHGGNPPSNEPPPPCNPTGGSRKEGIKGTGGEVVQTVADFQEWYRRDIKVGLELMLTRVLNRAVKSTDEGNPKLAGWFVIPEGAGAVALKIMLCNPQIGPPPKNPSSKGRMDVEVESRKAKGLLDDPVLDQLDGIYLDIVQVLYDLELERLANGSEDAFSQDIVNQVYAILAQADAAAGGNVQSYLENKKVELEEALRVSPYYNRGGMAVAEAPLPIYYAAVIVRPESNIILRGKTHPLTQYEIFTPRDGLLTQVLFYDPARKAFGTIVPNQDPNAEYPLPRTALFTQPQLTNPGVYEHADTDGDGLPDIVEFVIGTRSGTPDTDGDGVWDGAELDQGTDPLDGLPTSTGIIATADTPGNAIDIATGNDLVAVADSSTGISVFNVFNGMNPIVVAQV
ncbi:MAG: Ig-like domain-containing protein, partial [Candidatus Omnitrophica bacterium]|nr:Ig-like domain-containing protein [Candidatus Omnitrophota bacterium]